LGGVKCLVFWVWSGGMQVHQGTVETYLASVLTDAVLSKPCTLHPRERICIELMTSDRKLKASREGSK